MKQSVSTRVLIFSIFFAILFSSSTYPFDPNPLRLPPAILPGYTITFSSLIGDLYILSEQTGVLHPDHENIVLNAMNTLGGFSSLIKIRLMNCVGISDYIKILNNLLELAAEWVANTSIFTLTIPLIIEFVELNLIPYIAIYTNETTQDVYWHYLKNRFTEAGSLIKTKRGLAASYLENGNSNYTAGQLGIIFHAIADFFAHTTWVEHYKSDTIEGLDLDNLTNENKPNWLFENLVSNDRPSESIYHEKAVRAAIQETIKQWWLFEKELYNYCIASQSNFTELITQFGVTPGIKLDLFPNYLKSGTTFTITWYHRAIPPNKNIRILLEKINTSGPGMTTLVGEISEFPILSKNTYKWAVGQYEGGSVPAQEDDPGYQIRIETDDGQWFADSIIFHIIDLKIIQPNGRENWGIHSSKSIKWQCVGLNGTAKLELFKSNQSMDYYKIAEVDIDDKTYDWEVGKYEGGWVDPGTNWKVRIESIGGQDTDGVSDWSNGTFTISPPGIAITNPNGGQNLLQGSTYQIEWSNNGVTPNVKLELYKGTTLKGVIANNIPANSSPYTWTVPTAEVGSDYKIKISTMDNAYSDMSDGNFSIVGESITIIQPNGGQTWRSGTTHAITWSSVSSAVNVSLSYSIDNGTTWQVIENSITNDGSYDWLIPDIAEESDQCLIRVSDAADGYPSDVCDGVFILLPHSPLTISAPNGGEVWRPNSSHDITWTSDDGSGIANVKLDFSDDNGSTWSAITDSTANNGTYPWTLPDTSSTQCLVKVSDAANPNAFDESDGIFSISSSSSTGPDFNNDGFPDILWRKYTGTGAGNNAVWLMNGLTKIQSQAIASLADMSWKIRGVGDFTGDGKPDILWRKYSDPGKGANAIWEMDGITKVRSIDIALLTDMTWDIVGVGDFTGDGKADILWREYSGTGAGNNAIWEMDGVTKVVATTVTALADMTWDIVGVGDFTGDGKADILWRKYSGTGTGNNAVWEMDGVNKVRSINIAPQAAMTLDIGAVADYNKDGKVDIVWRQYASSGTNYVWLMDGLNKTTSVQIETLGDLAWHIVNNGGREH